MKSINKVLIEIFIMGLIWFDITSISKIKYLVDLFLDIVSKVT